LRNLNFQKIFSLKKVTGPERGGNFFILTLRRPTTGVQQQDGYSSSAAGEMQGQRKI
jgi:hypothetical protein